MKIILFVVLGWALLLSGCDNNATNSSKDSSEPAASEENIASGGEPLSSVGSQTSQAVQESGSETVLQTQDHLLKLAILSTSDFFPDRTVAQTIGLPDALAARVIENLSKSNRFQILERTALRKVINEQEFGQNKESFLDRSLNASVENLTEVDGLTAAVTDFASNANDLIKDYQNLGSAVGADYLVFAVLEKVTATTKSIELPYSESNLAFNQNKVDARLRLRIINAKTGAIAGVASFKTQLKESLLVGQESQQDEFSTFDHLGKLAAIEILNITFPAKIVGIDPLIVNRGTNDGFAEGQTYQVIREGQTVTDKTGVVLGKIKTPVGAMTITSAQETLSIADTIEGSLQMGDLLKVEAKDASDGGNALASEPEKSSNGNLNGKLKIAVGQIRTVAGGNTELFLDQYRKQVQEDLLVKLTNSKRFDVLERQEFDQVFDEKSFAALTQGQTIDRKLAELSEADYLVFTSVNDCYLKTERQRLAYVDEIQTRHEAVVDATLRIVNSHTGQLLAADKIRYQKPLKGVDSSHWDTLYADVFDDFTTALVSGIMSRLYPIKIIGMVSTNEFFINRGEDGGLKQGTVFDVFREGDEMIDPDTGLSFGKIETQVAQATVTSVEAARSRIQLLSEGGVQLGDVLRLSQAKPPEPQAPKVRKPNF